MTDYLSLIRERFPVRQGAARQAAFRQWLEAELRQLGCGTRSEQNGLSKRAALTANDPVHCAALFLVRTDTPARWLLPDLTVPANIPLWGLWQLLHLVLLFLPCLGVFALALRLGAAPRHALLCLVLTYVLLLFLMRFGPANRRNAGFDADLAAALSLIASLSPEDRRKAAFLFTDRDGARAWAKAHPQTAWTRLTVQLCRVGSGTHLVCLSGALARKATGCASLLRCIEAADRMTPVVADGRWSPVRGERRAFRCCVTLCACRRTPLLGLWANGGHTTSDRSASDENISQICHILTGFFSKVQLTD